MGCAVGLSVEKRKGRAAGSDPQRRRAALGAAHQRYGGLSAAGKMALVDELVVITGYHSSGQLPRGSAALNGAARQGMANSPSRAAAGDYAISRKGDADRGNDQFYRDTK
ncbi:MAG TPA: hypothetical protein DDY43_13170 [Synechococcales bacterium UBA10510]|nr:hypothetical protein [Synechococcales bacterium UBA10510]